MLLNKDNPQLNAISDPAKVNVNWMYRAGVRLNLGLSGRSGVEAYRQYTDSRVAAERALSQEELRKQRNAYDERLSQLDAQLKDAAARLDTAQVRLVATERARVEAERTRSNVEQTTVHVENAPAASRNAAAPAASRVVYMTPAQLDELIRRVIAAADARDTNTGAATTGRSSLTSPALSDFDKILLISALRNGQITPAAVQQAVPGYGTVQTAPAVNQSTTGVVSEAQVQALLKRIDELQKQVNAAQKTQTAAPAATVVPVRTRAAAAQSENNDNQTAPAAQTNTQQSQQAATQSQGKKQQSTKGSNQVRNNTNGTTTKAKTDSKNS